MQIKKYIHSLLLLTFSTLTYLIQAQNEAKMVLPIGHTQRVISAAYNASGSRIVTASSDKTARIWDAQTGELLHTLQGHTGRVLSAQYNASGSQIVTSSYDGTARIWDAETGELLHTLRGIHS